MLLLSLSLSPLIIIRVYFFSRAILEKPKCKSDIVSSNRLVQFLTHEKIFRHDA